MANLIRKIEFDSRTLGNADPKEMPNLYITFDPFQILKLSKKKKGLQTCLILLVDFVLLIVEEVWRGQASKRPRQKRYHKSTLSLKKHLK